MLRTLLLWLVLGGSFCAGIRGQDLEAGRPFLQTFEVRDYRAHPQNWGAAQDARGVMYFGNQGVVLEFDGVSWHKLPVPNTTFVRGVAWDSASDRIYLGAVDQLGFLRLEPDGSRAFVSLLDQLPPAERAFRDVRRVLVPTPGEVFFVAEHQVMRWRDGRFTVWHPGNTERLHAFAVDGHFYLHSRDLGLRRLDGDTFVPLPADPDFQHAHEITVLLAGAHPGELLLGTDDAALWTLPASGSATPFPTGADTLLRAKGLRLGRRLPDGTLALAMPDDGLLWLGADGCFLNRLDQATGLPRDQILDLFVDREHGLWLSLSSGLARAELSGTTTLFNTDSGLPRTTTNDLVRVDGKLYLATDNGLFRLDPADPSKGRPANWTHVADGELWAVCPDGTGGLLAATTAGVYRYHADGRTEDVLGGVQPRTLIQSRRDPSRAWLGLNGGLRSLRRIDDRWQDEGPVPGIEEEVRTIVEMPDGSLWLGTQTRGVFHVQFRPETNDGLRVADVQPYHQTHGLPADMLWTRTIAWHKHTDVLFAGEAGLYRYDPAQDYFYPVTEYGTRLSDGSFRLGQLAEDAGDCLWLSGRARTGVWLDQELGRACPGGRWEPLSGRIVDRLGELQGILPETNTDGAGFVWIYGTEGVARVAVPRWGTLAREDDGGAFDTHLRRAFTTNGPEQPLPLTNGGMLAAARDSLRFEFAAGTFRYGAGVLYQTRLDGSDEGRWSELSARTDVDYTHLPEGRYTFRVRSMDQDGHAGREATFGFGVLPPWSRTFWAYTLYAALAAGAVLGLLRWRGRRLRRVNARLEDRVTRQTDELVRARDTAEAANRAKSAFLANMSHELRTPLNAVLGYTHIMLKEPTVSEKNRERLGVVARSGEHLLAMINEVLDLSKIEAGKVAIHPEDFPLARLLDAAAETFGPRAAEKRVDFVLRRAPDLPVSVHGDEGKLRQVLFNLLGNAVKFTARGSVECTVARAETPDRLHVEVRDTGIGIATDQLEKIFLAFHQAPGSGANLASQGTGLGLAISQRLVAMLGGDLRVESSPGAGSRFWFDLPLPEVASLEAAALPTTASVSAGATVTGYRGDRRCLLVVDDDEINRRVLRDLLVPLGFEVELLPGGDECLARCARPPRVDGVLLDLRMIGTDGYSTARALRARPANAGLKIIAVSASVFESDRQSALDAGCDDFLPKPFAETALLASLGNALGLEWTTACPVHAPVAATLAAGTGAGAVAGALPPSPAEVDTLLELSRRGDILKIRRRLADLVSADPRHAGFVEPLRALAASYQMNRLRDALLELKERAV